MGETTKRRTYEAIQSHKSQKKRKKQYISASAFLLSSVDQGIKICWM